jgi:transposase InsO family protein
MEGIADSVGSVGSAYDNALMESIIGLYKTECLPAGPFLTQCRSVRRRAAHCRISPGVAVAS